MLEMRVETQEGVQIKQGNTNPGRQVAWATNFITVALSMCGSLCMETCFVSPSSRLEF
jgi:hypothetical protein